MSRAAVLTALVLLGVPGGAGAAFLIDWPHVPSQLLVTFVDPQACPIGRPGLPPHAGLTPETVAAPDHVPTGPVRVAQSIVAGVGGEVVHCLLYRHTWLIEFRPALDDAQLEQRAQALVSRREVERVTANNRVMLQQGTPPNDPEWSSQWALKRIDVEGAWSVTHGSRDVRVAVVDSGIDIKHEDLAGNVWFNPCEGSNGEDDECEGSPEGNGFPDDVHGWNFFDGNRDVQDTYGHGTQVAGVIGAVAHNGSGIAGISRQVSLIAVKVAHGSAGTDITKTVDGIDYARGVGAHVINGSWVAAPSPELEQAILRARDDGIVLVTGAGYWQLAGRDLEVHEVFPASWKLENVLVVTATDAEDVRFATSNFGKHTVDVGAPGDSVLSTFPTGSGVPYKTAFDTSIAAPHVTGVVALILARCPEEGFAKIRERVRNGDLMASPADSISGKRLNARKAVEPACAPRRATAWTDWLAEWWDVLIARVLAWIKGLLALF